MMTKGPEFAPDLHPEHQQFAVVVARFNRAITERLLAGAQEAFAQYHVPAAAVDVVWVPGCFEIPFLAERLAASGAYQGVVCLGAVVQGETAHFEHVAREAASGIAAVARTTGVPVLFGVLTTYTWEQAMGRAGGKDGNKGYEAAMAAMEMAALLENLPAAAPRSQNPSPSEQDAGEPVGPWLLR